MELCKDSNLWQYITTQYKRTEKQRQMSRDRDRDREKEREQKDYQEERGRSNPDLNKTGGNSADRRTLARIAGGAEQNEALIWGWIKQIASALIFCHHGIMHTEPSNVPLRSDGVNHRPILHRDLKPDNSKYSHCIACMHSKHCCAHKNNANAVFFNLNDASSDELVVKVGDFGNSVEITGKSSYRTWPEGNDDYVAPVCSTTSHTIYATNFIL
jgi:serine/threonine protein kinase